MGSIKPIIFLLFLTSLAFADTTYVDTLCIKENWFVFFNIQEKDSFFAYDTTNACAWRGGYSAGDCGSLYKGLGTLGTGSCILSASDVYIDFSESYSLARSGIIFDTRHCVFAESCKVRIHLVNVFSYDGDSLWIVEFQPRRQSDCEESWSNLDDSCNFFACGSPTFLFSQVGGYCIPVDTGYCEIPLDTSLFNNGGYTGLGLVTKREYVIPSTGVNIFQTDTWEAGGTDICQLIYWYKPQNTIEVSQSKWGNSDGWNTNRWGKKAWSQ